MRVDKKRVFISDLPETATEVEITNAFQSYGKVASVEIKERKELGPRNKSLFFAYINIQIDDRNLQQCFQDFANKKWHGQYVELQLARESFLERLKREREENGVGQNTVENLRKVADAPQQNVNLINGFKKQKTTKYKSSSESDSESGTSEGESKKKIKKTSPKVIISNVKSESSDRRRHLEDEEFQATNEIVGLVIKSNKGKSVDKTGLKIESVGNEPIIRIDKSKKNTVNTSEANLKRLQSLNNLKKGYKSQKSLIQAALSKIDIKSTNKIIFDNHTETKSRSNQKDKEQRKLLFDDNASEEELEPNFAIKEQFQGHKGQKLLELQSRYKNDKRFVLDQRFLEGVVDGHEIVNGVEDSEEVTLEEEKRKEYEILEQILGKKVTSKYPQQNDSSQKRAMLRYDPTQPDHSRFELQEEERQVKKTKRKRKEPEIDTLAEKKQEEKEAPEVSKEIFYKVTDNLKESLQEKQEFSLLNMFGKGDVGGEKNQDAEESFKQLNSSSSFPNERNPFRYDSSDDEHEQENIDKTENPPLPEKVAQIVQNRSTSNSFWSEPFFFKTDDYRLQEGFDFIEKMKSDDKTEFGKLRRDLKEIVKAKVRNNQRKNKPFKKKLGGSKRKKMIRMKRALKR